MAQITVGLRKAEAILKRSYPRTGLATFGSPRWGDEINGYRLDPPHPPKDGRNPIEYHWHINIYQGGVELDPIQVSDV